ncbi:unnamed protein product, partial [Polarella glacialis]
LEAGPLAKSSWDSHAAVPSHVFFQQVSLLSDKEAPIGCLITLMLGDEVPPPGTEGCPQCSNSPLVEGCLHPSGMLSNPHYLVRVSVSLRNHSGVRVSAEFLKSLPRDLSPGLPRDRRKS